jgi:hypothetical protein
VTKNVNHVAELGLHIKWGESRLLTLPRLKVRKSDYRIDGISARL